jgi:hypothetical protein
MRNDNGRQRCSLLGLALQDDLQQEVVIVFVVIPLPSAWGHLPQKKTQNNS